MKRKCQGNPLCSSLNEDTRAMLCKYATVSYQIPKQIQSVQSNDQLEIISEGVLLKYILFEDGTQESIDVMSKGKIIGEHLLLWDNPSLSSPHLIDGPHYTDFYTMALTEVTKCHFPIEIVRTLFENNTQFSRVLLQYLSQDIVRLQINAMKVRTLNGAKKVEFVYQVLKNLGVDMQIITQEDLAMIVGVSRNTIVRALKEIQQH